MNRYPSVELIYCTVLYRSALILVTMTVGFFNSIKWLASIANSFNAIEQI